MAPRSYLARIAQPLAAGDPVVWSAPRALAEEARPPVIGPVADPPRARSSAQGRPNPSRRGPAQPPASPEATPGARPRPEASPAAAAAAAGPDHGGPALEADSGPAPARAAERGEFPALTPWPATASVDRASPSGAPRAERREPGPASAQADRVDRAPTSDSSEPSAPSLAEPPRHARSTPPPADVSRLGPQETAPAPRFDRAAPPIAAADPPRLHIGTIEVRATPPQVPAPAPGPAPAQAASRPPAPGRIGRAYAWRFGLAQG